METPESRGVVAAPSGVAAFVDNFSSGPIARPVNVGSLKEFTDLFGRADPEVTGALAVKHFFDNGGEQAWVCGNSHDPGITVLEALYYAVDSLRDVTFDLLCVPASAALDQPGDMASPELGSFAKYVAGLCEGRQAMFLLDPPHWIDDAETMVTWARANRISYPDVAVWFPQLQVETDCGVRRVGASGAMAGVIARLGRELGIWQAPAGTRARLSGVSGIERLSEFEMGELNQAGVNSIRTGSGGTIMGWGARTTAGTADYSGEWRYLNVRRTAQYVRRSIIGSGLWPVGVPNDESLWSGIRAAVDTFCLQLFRDGALRGNRPDEAWFVRCDASTTTQGDIDDGVVNVLVGLALIRPAEFAVLEIQLSAPTQVPDPTQS